MEFTSWQEEAERTARLAREEVRRERARIELLEPSPKYAEESAEEIHTADSR